MRPLYPTAGPPARRHHPHPPSLSIHQQVVSRGSHAVCFELAWGLIRVRSNPHRIQIVLPGLLGSDPFLKFAKTATARLNHDTARRCRRRRRQRRTSDMEDRARSRAAHCRRRRSSGGCRPATLHASPEQRFGPQQLLGRPWRSEAWVVRGECAICAGVGRVIGSNSNFWKN